LGGGVGGTGELLCGFTSDGHRLAVGIRRLGYRFRLLVEYVELLIDMVARLLGRLSVKEGHSRSSSSDASYRSSNGRNPCCHSSSEHDEEVEESVSAGVDILLAVSGENDIAI
jgi:hypothetical protein